jgi:predicted kinase
MEPSRLVKPHLIIMTGISGAGKNFFANNFAKSFSAPIISSNLIRQNLFEQPTFEPAEDFLIDKTTNYLLNEMLKTKGTVVLKCKADTHAERLAIYKKCKAAGYEPLLIWVQTDKETARKRQSKLFKDKKQSDKIFDLRLKQFSKPLEKENPFVISGKFNFQSQQKAVLKRLANIAQSDVKPKINNNHQDKRRFLIR